jgi:hypothetical protein
MTKVYGFSLLINSLVILLMSVAQTYAAIAIMPSTGPQVSLFVTIGICAFLMFLGYRFIMRSVHALKGDLTVSSPETAFRKIIFFVGFSLLALSAVIHMATFTMIGYFAIIKAIGVPAGMGSGLGLLVFIVSIFLLGPTLKTHNTSLQSTGYAGG